MNETLCVLALDAADYRLARRWGCENLLLDRHAELETFTHTLDTPFTLEVWTTVATGRHPTEHEVQDEFQHWENPLLQFASQFTRYLPSSWRRRLGRPFRDRGHELSFSQTNMNHVFENGAVFGWPGITAAEHLEEAWGWTSDAEKEMSEAELRRNVIGNTGKEIGWLLAMADLDVPIAGVHTHVLDVAGHVFARREQKLREYYETVDELVCVLREEVMALVVLSDHGMQTSFLDDPAPGAHSMRSFVAATNAVGGTLPDSVFDVQPWLQDNLPETAPMDETAVTMDTARERLQELGYLE